MEYLTFHVGEREFAIDMRRVQEIVAPPPISRVPDMPPALLGLAGLRGEPTAVIDAGLRLDGWRIAITGRTPLLVLNVLQQDRMITLGLLVEAAGRKLELDALLPWTEGLARFAGADACTGFADVDGAMVIVLDVDQLLDFRRIRAAAPRALPEGRRVPALAGGAPGGSGGGAGGGAGGGSSGHGASAGGPSLAASTSSADLRALASVEADRAAGAESPPHPAPLPRWGRGSDGMAEPLPRWGRGISSPDLSLPESGSGVPADPAVAHPVRSRFPLAAAAVLLALLLLAGLFSFLGDDGDAKSRSAASSRATAIRESPVAQSPVHVADASPLSLPSPDTERVEPPPPAPSAPAHSSVAAPSVATSTTTTSKPAPASLPPAAAPSAATSMTTASRPAPPVAAPSAAATKTASGPPAAAPAKPAAPLARTARPLPPSMVVTPETPACEIHEVVRGDTLWWIAARRLGSPYKWPRLFGENRDRLDDPNVIEVHDRIRVPGGCDPSAAR